MRGETCARAGWVVGFSAAAAVIAHAGPAGLADPAWVSVALLGAVIALAASIAAGAAAMRLRTRTMRVQRSDLAAAAGPISAGDTPLPALFGLFMVCQTAAHSSLLLLGIHGTANGALALHVGLAMLGALLLWLCQQWFRREVARLAELVAALADVLRAAPRRWSPRLEIPVRSRRADSLGARGPPAAVPAR